MPADDVRTRVMVVEDDPRFLDAFVAAVHGAPDLTLTVSAATLAEALRALNGPPADVLLTDLQLPDGSGIDLIRRMRQLWPTCQAVVATVFGDEAHVLAAVKAGAVGYLLKDSTADSFVEQLRTLRAGGSPISPLIARHLLRHLQPAPLQAAPVNPLSEREAEVLQAITKGFSFDEIARMLGVSRHTVLTYGRRIYAKLEVNSKTEAVYEARRMGLVRD
jgi:DNA-binding NarL/FixJ family response regulator